MTGPPYSQSSLPTPFPDLFQERVAILGMEMVVMELWRASFFRKKRAGEMEMVTGPQYSQNIRSIPLLDLLQDRVAFLRQEMVVLELEHTSFSRNERAWAIGEGTAP